MSNNNMLLRVLVVWFLVLSIITLGGAQPSQIGPPAALSFSMPVTFTSPVTFQSTPLSMLGSGVSTTIPTQVSEFYVASNALPNKVNIFNTANPAIALSSVLATTDFAADMVLAQNASTVPRIWAHNAIATKNCTIAACGATNSAAAYEASVSNNTAENGTPLGNGQVSGFWASYIGSTGDGTTAFQSGASPTGGPTVGFLFGAYLDGVVTGGTLIALDNGTWGHTNAVGNGIDFTRISPNFSNAAVFFGNSQIVLWQNANATNGATLVEDSGNNLLLRAGASAQTFFQNSAGTVTAFQTNAGATPTVTIAGGTPIAGHFSGTGVVNPGAIAAISNAVVTMTVTGAVVTNTATVYCSPAANPVVAGGFTFAYFVSAANTVSIVIGNPSAAVQTPTSQTWRCDVWQH